MNINPKELRDYLALWSVSGIGSMTSRKLIAYAGNAENALKLKQTDLIKVPGIGPKLVEALLVGGHYERADNELEFIQKYKITVNSIFDDDYPYRLKQCEDAPLLLFTKGKPLVDDRKYISIVGTRSATPYGKETCERIIAELKEKEHDVIIVSGLAYGIDIAAHKSALKHKLPTYGVLAHGLDTIYPAQHRKVAADMLAEGGVITEFMHGMFPDKNNFIRRNRVIAGLCDATLVIESDIKGGSLITADLANSYNRDVFAVPGRLYDRYSLGTNKLIKSNRAALLESVSDLEYILGWEANAKPKQKTLFQNFTHEEKVIMELFELEEKLNIDTICRNSGFTMSKVSALLLNLEFMGTMRCLPGKVFSKV